MPGEDMEEEADMEEEEDMEEEDTGCKMRLDPPAYLLEIICVHARRRPFSHT